MFKLSIKGRLNLQASITVILILIVGSIGYYVFNLASKNITELIENKLPSVRHVALIDMHHEGIKSIIKQATIAKINNNQTQVKQAAKDLSESDKAVKALFEEFFKVEKDEEILTEIKNIQMQFDSYVLLGNKILQKMLVDNSDSAESLSKEFDSKFEELELSMEKFGEKYEAKSKSYFSNVKTTLKDYAYVLLALLLGGIIFSIVISQIVIKSVIKTMNSFAEGVSHSSMNLGLSISQLSLSSEQLATAVSEESAALQETAASVEEISAMVLKSSENAQNTSKSSDATKEKALNGQEVMRDLVSAIQDISETNQAVDHEVKESNNRINEILTVIQEIGNKTKVINDIVFQTKLLSFNASVEAARAGENGKGFAVVAEEVGNLAQMSGNAAKEITTLLEDSLNRVQKIADESKTKIEAIMKQTQDKVQKGTTVAKSFESILNEIVEDAQRSSDLVSEITRASKEQANGVSEISKAINQLNQATQVNSMAAETSSSTAESLKKQSNDLRQEASNLRVAIEGRISVPRFIWRDEYALEIADMDGEHKILINKINFLAEKIEDANGGSSAKVIDAFTDLANYTIHHFSEEEQFMGSFKYPQLEGHKEIHKRLIKTVLDFKDRIVDGTYDPMELMNFLNDWLVSHILNVDMKYSRFYLDKSKVG
ncbi:MAG: bacteriohemerythrin [Bdellovibrionaceae bacterium]|nr:bacteriohemerythrin [Pseudobdellovibrionaceae bacterium]